jgi:hypothetical protein
MKTKDNKFWYTLAGIPPIILALLLVLGYFESEIINTLRRMGYTYSYIYWTQIVFILDYTFSIIFACGLIKLSKKYNKKFFKVTSWIFLVLSAILLLEQLLLVLNIAKVYILPIVILLGAHLVGLFFLSAILLGFGMLTLRKDVKLSLHIGILLIIGSAIRLPYYYITRTIPFEIVILWAPYFTIIATIYYIFLVLAFILSAVLLFKESKK